MRADRLVSLVLLLQARGRVTASDLAGELGVSVRTVYRDLAGLGAAGVPVLAEPGPGGGCQLMDGYRFPLRGLRPEEADALLLLGVPDALRELGSVSAGASAGASADGSAQRPARVHLDMPRWFRSREQVPHLHSLAEAVRQGRRLELAYQRDSGPAAAATPRVVSPLGLVNKAGIWYLVAASGGGRVIALRASRIGAARVLAERVRRPDGFDLARFWDQWSRDFVASRPRLAVRLRASSSAVAAFGEVLGDEAAAAVSAAAPADAQGWRELRLTFEHETAAAHRLAGFGGEIEVLSPQGVRDRLTAAARGILDRYAAAARDDGFTGAAQRVE